MIIDAYSHLGTKGDVKGFIIDPVILREIPDLGAEEAAKKWLEVMEENDIEKTIFLAVTENNEEFDKFVNFSEKLVGVAYIDITKDNAVENMEKYVEKGYRGLVLYPVWDKFDVAGEKARKIYEYCNEKELPIIFHFGVVARPGDMRYANPLNLGSVVRDFPKVKFIIAHFGAGFFNEALLMCYKADNVYFDTSGTNNWLDYSPFGWTLKDVFKIALKAVGSERIIWGSDSYKTYTDGYRKNILELQRKIVRELCNKKEEENIFYNNAKRVYGI